MVQKTQTSQRLQEFEEIVNTKGKKAAIRLMALPGTWDGLKPIPQAVIPEELVFHPDQDAEGHDENCWKKEARAVVSTLSQVWTRSPFFNK